ncbi:MAG: flagellar hook-associated protein FlgK [Rhodobacteraceae bacterium]|nr:flagellar hook-associated protein FlgK [Paracoccaceae bacterium]
MSVSGSLFNAYSGLVASARMAEAVSHNVANALTPGYGRREVELTAAGLNGRGAGVRIADIRRDVNAAAIADRRLAEADLDGAGSRSEALGRLEQAIGIPGEAGSLSDLVTRFETALSAAESRPDSDVRLQNVLFAARDLTNAVNRISDTTQTLRMEADHDIDVAVGMLNATLGQVAELNRDIRVQTRAGQDVNGLLDQRQVLVDQISGLVPIRVLPRDHGEIAIMTTGGASLLDGVTGELGFTGAGLITTDMSLASGALSGLTLRGKEVAIGSGTGPFAGGRLAALFDIRDRIAPATSAGIDAFARDLAERLETPGLDPTLPPGSAGLFTDASNPTDPALEAGLAGRLAVNIAADPDAGGALWRLRDGLGAALPGEVGDNRLLSGFAAALAALRVPASGAFGASARSLSGLAGDLAGRTGADRLQSEDRESYAAARFQQLQGLEADSGVDTDQEMQKLLLIENAYAANARVVSTVDEMLKTILGL